LNTLVINLASEKVRMEFQARQLSKLGLPFTRLEARTPQSLPLPASDKYWKRWERPMRGPEMAAYASHRAAWELVAGGNLPVLILEDDALLMPGVPNFLRKIAGVTGVDHVSLETRSRRKLVSNAAHQDAPMRRLWQDRSGAAAYVLWPSGALKLLKQTPAIADAVICAAYDLTSYQADPAMAIQIDQCNAFGIEPPIEVGSAILAARRPSVEGLSAMERAGFRLRRIAAQLRMGIRHASHLAGSSRRLVKLSAQAEGE
jgi:glycosyl transferase, family 25